MIPQDQKLDENLYLQVAPKKTTSMMLGLKDNSFKWDMVAKITENIAENVSNNSEELLTMNLNLLQNEMESNGG